MFVLGSSVLLMRYTPWASEVANSLNHKPVLMPLLVVSIALLGLIWQHQRHGLIGNDGAAQQKRRWIPHTQSGKEITVDILFWRNKKIAVDRKSTAILFLRLPSIVRLTDCR